MTAALAPVLAAHSDRWPLLTLARQSREGSPGAHREFRERLAEILELVADGRCLDVEADRLAVADLVALAMETD